MNRRRVLAPLAALVVLLGSARRSRSDGGCPLGGYADLSKTRVSGNVEVVLSSRTFTAVAAQYPFALSSAGAPSWSPIGRGDAVDFSFALLEGAGDRPTVGLACHRASHETIASGRPIAFRRLCGAAAFAADTPATPSDPSASLRVRATLGAAGTARNVWLVFDLSHVDGTATGASTLDASGNGTVSVTLDIPSVALTTSAILDVDSGTVVPDVSPVTVRFSATSLSGSTTFATRYDACPPDAGGCSCGNQYGGWLPGK